MRALIFAALGVSLFSSVVSAATGERSLTWKKHYGTSKRLAQAAQRPMLVVLENPANKKETIDVTKLGTEQRKILAKDHFELCRVNVNTDYGKRVAQAFGAKVFPYTVVTDDASKRIVYRKTGPMSDKDWTLALAKQKRAEEKSARMSGTHAQEQPFEFSIQPIIPASGTCYT